MNTQQIVSALQSRLAVRASKISDMEWDYIFYKMKAEATHLRKDWKVVRGIRDTIKPLAWEQKFERDVMLLLISQDRSLNQKLRDYFV